MPKCRLRHLPLTILVMTGLIIIVACAPAASAAKTRVEVYSWWITGPEAVGLQKLIGQFNAGHPDAEVINAALAPAAGSSAEAALKTRMLEGDPPDSFQVDMGHELIDSWVKTGFMEPLDDVYSQYKLNEVFPPGVLGIVSHDGHPYSVPVNIRRANVMWYNKTVLDAHGIDPASLGTFDGWKAAADTLKAAGITPLALGDGDSRADTNLFETILIGTLGADGYQGLFDGTTSWSSPGVTTALEHFKMMVACANSDHRALSWDQANQLVIDSRAAFTIIDDWADADYTAKRFSDYGWVPPPGNKGVYDAFSDSFGLPKNSKHPELMKEFLGVLGSKQGQEQFNSLNGSICARTDCGYSNFDAYLQSSAADWKTDTIVPSVAHGAAVSEGWLSDINDAISVFVSSGDIAGTQTALAQACRDAGICK